MDHRFVLAHKPNPRGGHYERFRSIWFEHATAGSGGPPGSWLPAAIDGWLAYVEQHPFAGRMLFRDTTDNPDLASACRAIHETSRDELLPLLAAVAGTRLDLADPHALELAWETLRAVLQGLALWWYDHPDVQRESLVQGTSPTGSR